jgi:hypothetical protein
MDIKYDFLYLGPNPCEEPCADMEDYAEMSKEVRRYVQLLKDCFVNAPDSCYFGIVSERHEFGTYKEAVIYFEHKNKEAMDFALFVESNSPKTWKDTKKIVWKPALTV